ncbi:type II toxin-antitoxin system HicB family antitoxin [Corynebacterium sp. MSK044]|uniref:type II toxin-antitoxin system HicB family antitoxin n=1 Tax=Corynebacterium sp. MSK044 TaxID=3050195 RepID=UPI00254AB01C|nr:type II toxin-antitoxin system HicB family antitoxin [Corynebacterium sp. MSK044]MDK8797095.1 type II toxin-antitoxin system HicB family antitoxin [Corynebacterium sp. MSK044]
MNADKYTYQVGWSQADGQFVATVREFPSLSWLEDSRDEAEKGILSLVEEVLADLLKSGEPIPQPLGMREFSGRFNVRISPSLHRRLVQEAENEGISLNALVSQKLASA